MNNENEISIRFNVPDDIDSIVMLSKEFESENCCNGIIADDKEFFTDKNVAVAIINNSVIGYCYGEFETKTRNSTFYRQGEKCFYIEEMFVNKNHRNLNVGQKLFNFIENYAIQNGCSLLEVTAVNKDYQKILSFYVDKLKMKFFSASLIKNIS